MFETTNQQTYTSFKQATAQRVQLNMGVYIYILYQFAIFQVLQFGNKNEAVAHLTIKNKNHPQIPGSLLIWKPKLSAKFLHDFSDHLTCAQQDR